MKTRRRARFEKHISYAKKVNSCEHDDDVDGNRNENGRMGEGGKTQLMRMDSGETGE